MSTERPERGNAIIEVLGVGFLVVLLLVPLLIGVGRLQAADEAVRDAAHTAALIIARNGDVASGTSAAVALAPIGASVEVAATLDRVTVTVDYELTLVGPDGLLTRTVQTVATARVSPYRSSRG